MSDEDWDRLEAARAENYRVRCLQERARANRFLSDLLVVARRRYWGWREDPISQEDAARRQRAEMKLYLHYSTAVPRPIDVLKNINVI